MLVAAHQLALIKDVAFHRTLQLRARFLRLTHPELGCPYAVLRLLQAALHSYLDDFGHEESDVLREIKALLAKLPGSQPPAAA